MFLHERHIYRSGFYGKTGTDGRNLQIAEERMKDEHSYSSMLLPGPEEKQMKKRRSLKEREREKERGHLSSSLSKEFFYQKQETEYKRHGKPLW